MSEEMKTLVEQYVGVSQPHIPSSGDAAEDYDRRNAWYDNARVRIQGNLQEAMPYLIDHLDNADNLMKRLGLDVLPVALPVIANRPDARTKAAQLARTLDGRVSNLFDAVSAYTRADHPDAVRATAVYMLAALDHPMRDETLNQLAQSGGAAVQQAAQIARGQSAAAPGETVTKEAAGVSYTFPGDVLDDLDSLKESSTQIRLGNRGAAVIPGLMYAIAEQQYSAYSYVLTILDQMTDPDLPQQIESYCQADQPPLVQAAALHTLGQYPDFPGLKGYLRQALTDGTHGQVHQEALEALAEVGSAADVDVVVPHLESTNGRTRTLAGLTLVDLGDARGAPTVYMQAESDFPGVRRQAVERLPKLADDPAARQHLKRLADDDDPAVKDAARQALRNL